jgi:YidC/Oxa1 family membrane protein insertase
MFGFLSAPLGAAYHVVFLLAELLAPLAGGLATAAAIIVFTMAVRLLLVPLSYHAFRSQAGLVQFQAKVQEVRKRYANRPERLQQELAEIYRQHGGGLLAGFLPLLIQLPIFSIMYRLFLSRTVAGQPNGLLTRNLLTTPLGSHWLSGAGPVSAHGLIFLALFALLAVVAFLAARVARGASQTPVDQSGPISAISKLLPYLTLVIAAFVPLAAGIYLLTTTAWTVAERAVMRRHSPVTSGTVPDARAPAR